MEKIIRIEDTTWSPTGSNSWCAFEGYQIITDKQTIRLGISNGQSCCENWGYFWCNEKPEDFVGATIREITVTDSALNTKELTERIGEYGCDGGDTMFVNVETDRGTLQFVAYNAHNGYYGHTALIESTQLTSEASL